MSCSCQRPADEITPTTDSGAISGTHTDSGTVSPIAPRGGGAAEERFRRCIVSLTSEQIDDNTNNLLRYGDYFVVVFYDEAKDESSVTAISSDGTQELLIAVLPGHRYLSAVNENTVFCSKFTGDGRYIDLMSGKVQPADFSEITKGEDSYVKPYNCGEFTFVRVDDNYYPEISEPVMSFYAKPKGTEAYIRLSGKEEWSAYGGNAYYYDFYKDEESGEYYYRYYSYNGKDEKLLISRLSDYSGGSRGYLVGKWIFDPKGEKSELVDVSTGASIFFDPKVHDEHGAADPELFKILGTGNGKIYYSYGEEKGFHSVDIQTGETVFIDTGTDVCSTMYYEGWIYFAEPTNGWPNAALYRAMPDGLETEKIG